MTKLNLRIGVLRAHGASSAAIPELLAYTETTVPPPDSLPRTYPLGDEPFVAVWREYARLAGADLFGFLAPRLVQLQFPIGDEVAETEHYRAVTRRGARGDPALGATGLPLRSPGQLRLDIHPTAAGRIPILITPDREDFVDLVRALTMRNRPKAVPASIGAWMIAGYNNWDRIRRRPQWEVEFPSLIAQKHLYQDRFILLSGGYYSGVPPEALGLDAIPWREKSLAIRRQHECTHYFTRRVLSSMRDHLADELIADYCGMVAAEGFFNSGWFLEFLGIENAPARRAGGRLENYRGDPPLSGEAFGVLTCLLRSAAGSLERFSRGNQAAAQSFEAQARTILALTALTIEEMTIPERLEEAFSNY